MSLQKKVIKGTSLVLAGLIASSTLPTTTYAQEKIKTDRIEQTNIKSNTMNPFMSIGTGYVDKFKMVINSNGVLNLKTTSRSAIALGIGTQTKTVISIDPEIATEFFSTPGYEKYIGGSVDRLSEIGIGNDTIKMSKLWNKRTGWLNGDDTAFYDKKTHSIVIYSHQSILSTTNYQNVHLTLDLDKWSKETGRYVERKPFYDFKLQSVKGDCGINWSWGAAESVLNHMNGGDVEDSWIENKVEPTTISSDDDRTFYGNAKQDRFNEHETDYTVDLFVNGNEAVKNIPMNENGDWKIDLSSYLLKDGTEIAARVIGIEKGTNGNGKVDTKQSTTSLYIVGKDSIPWSQWSIKAPSLSDAYDGETLIDGIVSKQNLQNDRTYTYVVEIDGQEVFSQKYDGDNVQLKVPLFDKQLHKGQKITMYVIGHEPGQPDKKSDVATMIVKENQEEESKWNNWVVKSATIDNVMENSTFIKTTVPIQNKFNARSYELQVYVNDQLIDTKKNISNLGGDFVSALPSGQQLKAGDTVKAIVIGHEPDEKDKQSEKTVMTVKDESNWGVWELADPTLNEVTSQDQKVTGHVPAQSVDFNRNYELQVRVNGETLKTEPVTSDTDYEITLPDNVKLKENDEVSVQLIGHQEGKDDKESNVVSTIVKKNELPTTSKFEIGYWESYGLVYEGQIFNEGWDMSDASRISKEVQLLNESGTVVKRVKAANTDWYAKGNYNGYQFIIDNDTLGSLPEGTYTLRMQVEIDGSVVGETDLELTRRLSRVGPQHDNYADLEQVVIKGNIVTPVVIDNHPGINISKVEKEDTN
ncbi:hypothetical protein [Lysinibacillus xylanilyticus]|uniref:hypothetical protein n=1 Tax=Lysinibacillus xylanilyticus TaxID=582475 RepID=UPI0037F4660E